MTITEMVLSRVGVRGRVEGTVNRLLGSRIKLDSRCFVNGSEFARCMVSISRYLED